MMLGRGGRLRLAGCACVLILSATGCEPPGKPKLEPASAQDITDFKTLYGENCSGCHGMDGKSGPGAPAE